MRRKRVLPVLIAGTAAGVLLLAGCSSTTTTTPAEPSPAGAASASPVAFLSEAADATTAAGSAKFRGTIATGETSDGSMTMNMEGAIDFTTSSVAMTMKFSSPR